MKRILMLSLMLFGMGLCASDEQGRDPYEPIVLPPLEKLKVELAMDPSIRGFLSSNVMNKVEDLLHKERVARGQFVDKYLVMPMQNYWKQKLQKEKERFDLLQEFANDLDSSDSLYKEQKQALDGMLRTSQFEGNFDNEMLNMVLPPQVDEQEKERLKPLQDQKLIHTLETIKNNMGIARDMSFKIDTGLPKLETANHRYGEIRLNPEEYTEGALSPFAEFALAHEMGHAKHNTNSERLLGIVGGGYSGYKILQAIGNKMRGSSRPIVAARSALSLLGAALGTYAGNKTVNKHMESIADISGLEHALPMYNAKTNENKFQQVLHVVNEMCGWTPESLTKLELEGYLSPEQKVYAAQRMYKPELHKSYETDNNPGQFLAEHGGI